MLIFLLILSVLELVLTGGLIYILLRGAPALHVKKAEDAEEDEEELKKRESLKKQWEAVMSYTGKGRDDD